MIKIESEIVESMLDQHWDWFCKFILTKKLIQEKANKKEKTKITYRRFIRKFFGWKITDLEKIVKVKPEEIELFADESEDYYQAYKNGIDKLNVSGLKFPKQSKKSNGCTSYKNISDVILEVFGYNDFLKGCSKWDKYDNGWGAYVFTQKLKIEVCPYCNRQYIFTIGNEESKDEIDDGEEKKWERKGRPEIDHFFPKADYPYLSCSLFNFVPSCHACNHQKSDLINKRIRDWDKIKNKKFKQENSYIKILYPYKEGFSNPNEIARFVISRRKKSDPEYKEKKYKISLKYNQSNIRIHNTIEVFHLEELYNLHQLELSELVDGCRDYCDAQRIYLAHFLARKLGNKKSSRNLICLYEKKIRDILLGIPHNANQIYLLKQLKEDLGKQFELNNFDINKILVE